MIIETSRLILREMNTGDYDALYAVLADSDIEKLGFVPGKMTVKFGSEVQEFVMEVAKWQIS